MAIEWSNKKGFDATWDNLLASVDPSAVMFMVKIGETAVRFAREHGSYQDQTGNLRHSIGFIVVQEGKVVHEWYDQGWQEAMTATKAHLLSLVSNYPHDTVLLWGSGMVYASYVENGHTSPNGGYVQPRDVIAGSGADIESRASELLRSFISNLLKNEGTVISRHS